MVGDRVPSAATECSICHALVADADAHRDWHNWSSMTQGQRLKAVLRREAERKVHDAD